MWITFIINCGYLKTTMRFKIKAKLPFQGDMLQDDSYLPSGVLHLK